MGQGGASMLVSKGYTFSYTPTCQNVAENTFSATFWKLEPPALQKVAENAFPATF